MIVFQIKGQSHKLSTPEGKEKDGIKIFSTYSTKYTKDTEVLGRQLSQARSKPDPVDRVRTVLAYDEHNYDAQQHSHCAATPLVLVDHSEQRLQSSQWPHDGGLRG